MNDPVRAYTIDEEEKLARNLLRIAGQIHRGQLRERNASVELLFDFHLALFSGDRKSVV